MELRQPWWNYEAADFIRSNLSDGATVWEYGGGASTSWLMDLNASITTIEHDPIWYTTLVSLSQSTSVRNIPCTEFGTISSEAAEGFFDEYVHSIDACPDESLNLVIIDGRCRVACGQSALPKIEPGGFILLDDSDRHRYNQLIDDLHDWDSFMFRGLKPGSWGVAETTIWRKPTTAQ
jgi:hypothetical protein